MRHRFLFGLIALALAFIVVSCGSRETSGTPKSTIRPDVPGSSSACTNAEDLPCLTVDVDGTIGLNQPVSVTISVTTRQPIADLEIGLEVSPASAQIEGEKFWPVGDVPANHTVQVTSTILFPSEAEYLIVAGVHNPMGMAYNTSVRLAVTAQGGTINVQPEPLVPPSSLRL